MTSEEVLKELKKDLCLTIKNFDEDYEHSKKRYEETKTNKDFQDLIEKYIQLSTLKSVEDKIWDLEHLDINY